MSRNPNCTNCDLCNKSPVICSPGTGNVKTPRLMVVMESPTAREAKGGRYLQSEAGQALLTMLENQGISRSDLFISHALGCVVPYKQKVKASHLKGCLPYLREEIEKIRPPWVLLCGSSPLKAIRRTGIMDYHANPIELDGINYFPMMSPGVIVRDPSRKPIIEKAIEKLAQLIRGEYEEPEEIEWYVVTPENVEGFLSAWDESKEISFDVETTGRIQQSPDFRVNSIAFTFSNLVSWCLPLEKNDDPVWAAKLLKQLGSRNGNEDKEFIAHNGKFDNNSIFSQYGFRFYLGFDTMLASHLLDENSPNGLKFLAQVYCGAEDYDDLTLREKTGHLPPEKLKKLYRYNCLDTYYTMLIKRLFRMKLVKHRRLNRLFKRLVMPAARAFEVIDYRGHYIRMDALEQARATTTARIIELEQEMNKYWPGRKLINWGSPSQVSKFLYGHLKLESTVLTGDGKPSTGEAALIDLKDKHPIVNLLLEWRGAKKNLSTYIDGYSDLMVGNKLYISTKLHGTVTGRFSSRLHQTPRDGTIRNIYGAPPGYLYVCADFSQIELRLVADASGDPTLRHIFRTGGDVHVATAQAAMGSDDIPTKDQRKAAKSINFGYIYGMGWRKYKSYAKEKYGVEVTDIESQQFRKRFFGNYYGLEPWHERVRQRVAAQGFMAYPSGRIRRLPGVFSSEESVRAEAMRQAINSPIQGFGSGDLKVMALLSLFEEFEMAGKDDLLLTGEVHDSILGWVREDKVQEIGPRIKQLMEHPKLLDRFGIEISVPLVVDVEIGDYWGDDKYTF